MTIAYFDHLPESEKKELLQMCCGSTAWIKKMIRIFPVNDLVDLLEYAELHCGGYRKICKRYDS